MAVACLPRRRSPDTISQRTAAPADRREPRQFAALTAREDEVAPRAGPLRAIAIRPQVALPACRALLTPASLTDAHLPTVTRHPAVPMGTRPADRHMPTPGLVHQVAGQHFDPAPQRPGVKRGRNRTRLAGLPVSGEQYRVSSHDRRTPTVPFTLRDQAFHPAKRAIPPIWAATSVPVLICRGGRICWLWAVRSQGRQASRMCVRPQPPRCPIRRMRGSRRARRRARSAG